MSIFKEPFFLSCPFYGVYFRYILVLFPLRALPRILPLKMQVKAGDKIIYSKYAGTEVKLEDEEYIIVKQSDILAIIE